MWRSSLRLMSAATKKNVTYERAPIPELLKNKSLNEKLDLFKAGVTTDTGPGVLVKLMFGMCTDDELSTLWL